MSTRSFIGYYDKNTKKVTYIYCHFDGYPSYNGAILDEHYRDINKIHKLLDLGNLSILRKNIGIAKPFEIHRELQDLNLYSSQEKNMEGSKFTEKHFITQQEITDLIDYLKANRSLKLSELSHERIYESDKRLLILLSKSCKPTEAPVLLLTYCYNLNSSLSDSQIQNLEKNVAFLTTNQNLTWQEIFQEINYDGCLFYMRDRGEKKQEAITCTLSEFYKHIYNSWSEYCYLYKDNSWLVYERNNSKLNLEQFKPLTKDLISNN
jgi:hypothetical protein